MFERASPRLGTWDYTTPGLYYVTICTKNREHLFGRVVDATVVLSRYGEIVWDCWFDIPNHYGNVRLIDVVVMPNHVHGIIEIVGAGHARPLRTSLPIVIGSFKSAVTKRINEHRNAPGRPVWQRSYYDHVIRDEEDLNRIRQYIQGNPAKWDEDEYR